MNLLSSRVKNVAAEGSLAYAAGPSYKVSLPVSTNPGQRFEGPLNEGWAIQKFLSDLCAPLVTLLLKTHRG